MKLEKVDLLNEEQRDTGKSLYTIIDVIPEKDRIKGNTKKIYQYGYNSEYDLVVISKDGTIGEIYQINGLKVALPEEPKKVYSRSAKKEDQYWERAEFPSALSKIKSIFQWNKMPLQFRNNWVDYIDAEFDRRDNGFWFKNNGISTYITGGHYMYLQWSSIDVGFPDFREANRILYIYWEACKADPRSFGMVYLKIRRSGFSYMADGEIVNIGTNIHNGRIGILSKTGPDAKTMFTDKVVPTFRNYPFFFKPIQDGMDNPRTELAFRIPSSKITAKNFKTMHDEEEPEEGLNTTIDWKNTADNSYDGEKLQLLVHDECYAPDTKILCEGMVFKPISEINVGDKVIIDGGKLKTVVKKTSGQSPMYRVNQKWGEDYIVSENHRLVLDRYLYNKGVSGRSEIIMTPPEYLKLSNFNKQHTFSVKAKAIDGNDDGITIPPYLLGLWLGDGKSATFSIIVNKEKDPEILHYLGRMSQVIGFEFSLKSIDGVPSCVRFEIKDRNQSLRDLGVLKNKHIPQSYMMSSMDSKLQLLAGLVDTDGYVDKKKKCISFGMSRKDLVEQIRLLAMSCGLSCSSVIEKQTNLDTKAYIISISGEINIIPTLVSRKNMEGYKKTYSNRRCGMSIDPIGVGEYVGIQVDGENDNERRLILSDFTVSLNSGKWSQPNNILNNWRVTKTCLRLGRKIIGKCMMGSTSNALDKGGENFKKLYEDSRPNKRSENDQTKSGLYALFIPMEWNMEGFIDKYGMPVFRKPEKPIIGVDGEVINLGAIDYWENEVKSLKSDPDALNEFYRQYPRTESHAFRDESKQSIFNLTKIYTQIDFNDSLIAGSFTTRGFFSWRDGKKDSEVIWTPDPRGRFNISWVPPRGLQNRVDRRGDLFYPMNEHIGAFGCDSYDISGTVDGFGSNGALHGLTKFNMEDAPSNEFFLEYVARPQTAEIFFEEVLMACFFYGMPVLAENNKPRLLYHMKNRGYRHFCLNRPDKPLSKLSPTERELGGIPNSSEDVRQAHASAIETYIEKNVGLDMEATYRDSSEMGSMYFNRTLNDWAKFDISNRTKYDASISSGLAIMANQKHMYQPERKESKISIKFARYKNNGTTSQIIS